MIRSMTGFASLAREDETAAVGVTIRAVNHRFLDLQLRLPAPLADLEARLRAIVQKRLARGRVEVNISLQMRQPPVPDVQLNVPFVAALSAAVARARADGLLDGGLTPGDLLRMPQALTIRERLSDGEATPAPIAGLVEETLTQSIDALERMRTTEGGHLRDDLSQRRAELARLIERVVLAAEAGRSAVEARLMERAQELAAALPIDQGALAQEVTRVAQRSDIAEEVTRFRGHLAHWEDITDAPEPCGRKLDFLLQEMNREVNTIGSKADGLHVSELVIQAKAELERMREQVQNVE